jgi:hypothetical protein
MKHRASSVLSLMFLAAACSSAPSGGGNAVTPDAGADPGPGGDPVPTPEKKDAAAVVADSAPVTPMADAAVSPPPVDATEPTTPPPDAGSPPVNTGPGSGDYSCTLVIGIAATGQWFNAGFEKLVDGNKWELEAVHSGFIQTWADPNGSFWNMNPSSACATNAKTPDRVIQVALWLHWMDATVDEWVKALDQVVKNWKAKNPNLKRLEFATFVRSPGGKPCQASMSFKSFIKPEQDMAYEKIAAMYPGLVYAAPKWEVGSCADFGGNPPHFSGAGATAAAKQIADYYNKKN